MILDTNALSAWLDGDPAIEPRLSAASRVVLSVIVMGEYRYPEFLKRLFEFTRFRPIFGRFESVTRC